MRNRILKILVGLLVAAVALSGLLGVLEQLSHTKPSDVTRNSAGPTGTAAPGNNGTASNLTPGNAPNVKLPSLPNASIPAGVLGAGNLPGLPTNILNPGTISTSPNGLSLNISPQGALPPHIPLFDVSGAAGISYMRSTAPSLYDDNMWKIDPSESFSPYLGERLTPDVKNFSKLTVSDVKVTPMQKFESGSLPLPTSMYPASVSSALPLTYSADEQAFISPKGMPDSYSFQSINYSFDPAFLNKASVDANSKYLKLPATTTDRVKQLAQDITQGASSPYQKAKAIESYLKNNYTYDFNYQPARQTPTLTTGFYSMKRKGFCPNFNSAFVELARSAGLPSRMVSGYAIKQTAAEQTVYADEGHAWAETKFKDLGWVTFDATGAAPAPVTTKTEITSVSPAILKGHAFTVQGTVQTITGEPVDGVPVELFINTSKLTTGGTKIGQGTVSNGVFSIEATVSDQINVGNYQLLAHSLGGIRYDHSWSDPQIKITTNTRISLSIPEKVKIAGPGSPPGNISGRIQ